MILIEILSLEQNRFSLKQRKDIKCVKDIVLFSGLVDADANWMG